MPDFVIVNGKPVLIPADVAADHAKRAEFVENALAGTKKDPAPTKKEK